MPKPPLESGWRRVRLRECYARTRSGSWGFEPSAEEAGLPCIRTADFDDSTLRLKEQPLAMRVPPRGEGGRIVPVCLLLERAGGHAKAVVGRVALYERVEPAMASNFLVIMEPAPDYDPIYLLHLHWALHELGVVGRYATGVGGIQNLDVRAYLNHGVCVPPVERQREIGRQLDRRFAELQRLCALRERELELLRERWRAVEQRAFHGGGGELPAGWQLLRLAHLADISQGYVFQSAEFRPAVACDDGLPVIRLSDLNDDALELRELPHIEAARVPEWAKAARGDVLVAMTSNVGVARLVSLDSAPTLSHVAVNQRVAIVRGGGSPDPYLVAYLRSWLFREQLEQISANSTVLANVSLDDVKRTNIPWPPAELRRQLADELNAAQRLHVELAEKLQTSLDLHRARLLSFAVSELRLEVSDGY